MSVLANPHLTHFLFGLIGSMYVSVCVRRLTRGVYIQWIMARVGQNRIYTAYITVDMAISLPKIPYTHRIYIWFWPTLIMVFVNGVQKNTANTFVSICSVLA